MILSFLNRPLPGAQFSLNSVFKYFLVGIFVTLFLLVFQPFEINLWETSYKTLKIMGYGLVSFLIPTIYSLLLFIFIPRQISEDRWTVGKEILSVSVVLFLIAFGNMVYSNMIMVVRFSFINFINALIPVVLLGVFPVSVLVLTRHNRLFKRNTAEAEVVNKHLREEGTKLVEQPIKSIVTDTLVLVSENGKDKIELKDIQLLYIESADNYSNIVFSENGQIKRQLIRSSLKRLEGQVNNPDILRCHRTYIINLKNVITVEGNAAGYKLSLSGSKEAIPVSRNFGPIIIEKLKSLK